MAEFPSLPLWTDAWVADTKHLTPCERGIYIDLLVLMWRSPQCRVPNSDGWLVKRLNMPAADFRPIIMEFCQCDGNWITQKRLIAEYKFVKEKFNRRSAAAKLRWAKEKSLSNAYAPTPTPTPREVREVPVADATKQTSEKERVVNETPMARLFREGRTILVALGVSEKQSGAVIGKWIKTNPDADGILSALTYAYLNNVMEPIGYVTKLLNTGGKTNGGGRKSLIEIGKELADEARRREFAAGVGRAPDFERSH